MYGISIRKIRMISFVGLAHFLFGILDIFVVFLINFVFVLFF